MRIVSFLQRALRPTAGARSLARGDVRTVGADLGFVATSRLGHLHVAPVRVRIDTWSRVLERPGRSHPTEGLASLDAVCQTEADNNGFGTSAGKTFLAFAATGTASAKSRFVSNTAPYVRLDDVMLGLASDVLEPSRCAPLVHQCTR